jgi:hypothetical protein
VRVHPPLQQQGHRGLPHAGAVPYPYPDPCPTHTRPVSNPYPTCARPVACSMLWHKSVAPSAQGPPSRTRSSCCPRDMLMMTNVLNDGPVG